MGRRRTLRRLFIIGRLLLINVSVYNNCLDFYNSSTHDLWGIWLALCFLGYENDGR